MLLLFVNKIFRFFSLKKREKSQLISLLFLLQQYFNTIYKFLQQNKRNI